MLTNRNYLIYLVFMVNNSYDVLYTAKQIEVMISSSWKQI